jgi:hypothetical protein
MASICLAGAVTASAREPGGIDRGDLKTSGADLLASR